MIENTFGKNIIPQNDPERLEALRRYRIMDTPSEDSFENIAKLCTEVFNVPISLVSLVDAERVFFKANVGMGNAKEANRGKSLCALAVLEPEVTVFEDALKEPCLIANPNIAGDFGLRFYAGAPLTTYDGFLIGTLCIIDKTPREFSRTEQNILKGMATAIMDQIELRLSAITEIEGHKDANKLLFEQQEELKTINEQLEFSETKFRDLVDKAPVAIAIYAGENFVIEKANEQMLALYNTTNHIIGKPLLEAIPEMTDHPYFAMLAAIKASGKESSITALKWPRIEDEQLADGYYDLFYKPLTDANGDAVIMVIASDVTNKYRILLTEQELHEEVKAMNEELMSANEELMASQEDLSVLNNNLSESESRFRKLIKQSPVAIAILHGKSFFIETANEVILKIWQKGEDVIGKPLHIALPELQGQRILGLLDNIYNSGKAHYGKEVKVSISQNDEPRDVYINFVYQPIFSENKVTDIVVIANDVTEQVEARKAVEEINHRLEIALDASKLGATEVELATGIMTCSAQFKANFGYSADEEFHYSDLFNAMLPDHRERIKGLVNAALDTDSIYKAEYPVKWPDGSIHWISAHGRARYNDQGKPNRMVGMTADITANKLFEQKKDDFLSIASHELKTPVTSLKASLQLLDRIKEKPTSTTHIKLIEQAVRSMGKMSMLVDDLLNVNRMTEGQLQLEKTNFKIAEMLRLCCNHIRFEGEYELIIKGDQDLVIYADENRIDQVVINFVNNAVKYAPESKKIYLTVEKIGELAKLSVTDFGPGIHPELLPSIFDRYYRVSHQGQHYSGLGLGLYICAEIIARHGGKIGVDSELGKGSTFWFTVPIK
ncbi:MAG: ATP-binding protein [Bacteroidota bacterium]